MILIDDLNLPDINVANIMQWASFIKAGSIIQWGLDVTGCLKGWLIDAN